MPFDPLETDEKLDKPIRAQKDFEAQMLAGCTAFVVISFVTYGLTILPLILMGDLHKLDRLLLAAAVSAGVSFTIGFVVCRRFGLPGASGFLGGVLASCVFAYLRLDQLMLGYSIREIAKPEFPRSWVWQGPLAFLLAAFFLAAIATRDPFGSEEPKSS